MEHKLRQALKSLVEENTIRHSITESQLKKRIPSTRILSLILIITY